MYFGYSVSVIFCYKVYNLSSIRQFQDCSIRVNLNNAITCLPIPAIPPYTSLFRAIVIAHI